MVEQKVRILIADRSDLIQDAYLQLMQEYPDLEVVAQPKDMEQTLKKIVQEKPDVALIDPEVFGRFGASIIREIMIRFPELCVIGLQVYSEDQERLEEIKNMGISTVLAKSAQPEEVYQQIQNCIQKKRFME